MINKSNINFRGEYFKKEYNCEICGDKHHFDDMSTCDSCGRFVCGNCSEAVVNRDVNPFGYDFLCKECIRELEVHNGF